jgi:tetratricopeptide (TPR) repeat protein
MKLWSLKNKRILVVDDFPGMRSMLKNMLVSYNPDIISEASNGEDALQLIAQDSFDVILCDYNLGEGKDGQQVLEEAKDRDLLPYSTIYIMTTAENTSEMVMGAVEHVPDNYLSKPFTSEVLISRLKKLVVRKENLKPISLAVQQKDYDRAIEHCMAALKKGPKNRYEILKILTDLYIRIKDYDHAEKIVRRVLDDRQMPWASLSLGKIFFYSEKYDDAKYIFEDLIEDNPNYLLAHDWLAGVYEKLGNLKKTQEVLQKAVERSPKSIKRQQNLAGVAFKNEDYDISEKAYKRIVRTGKHSIHSSPDDFGGLAKVYIQQGQTSEAVKTLDLMKKSFKRTSPESIIKTHINEALLYHKMEEADKSIASLESIITLFEEKPGVLHSSDAINIAELCYLNDKEKEGDKLVRHAIRNNHDNKETLIAIAASLTDIGLSKEKIAALMSSREEVVALNNRGVKLATTGKIEESILLFLESAAVMPENRVINLNTAQSLIMHMKNTAASDALLKQTKHYLDKVIFDGKPSDKYIKLTAIYRELKESIK